MEPLATPPTERGAWSNAAARKMAPIVHLHNAAMLSRIVTNAELGIVALLEYAKCKIL